MDVIIKKNEAGFEDKLSIFEKYTKYVYFFHNIYKIFRNSEFYRTLTRKVQSVHLIIICAVAVLAALFYPKKNDEERSLSSLYTLIYLGSFAVHFGTQIWMTFVSGLAIYFSLPRHTFGDIQKVLFPKYFLLNSILSLITLIIFMKQNDVNWNKPQEFLQAVIMTKCFLIELVIKLYLTPSLLRLIDRKKKIEQKAGVGKEIGKPVLGVLKHRKYYLKIRKSFRKVHMIIATGNMIAIACTTLHLHYLSDKICIL